MPLLFVQMVPKGGFEPPRGWPTTPSRWRVYQFHHFGIGLVKVRKLETFQRITSLAQALASEVEPEPFAILLELSGRVFL